jgi:deoxyribonuclease V
MTNYDEIQVEKAQQLNFDALANYVPAKDDCIITLDVYYENTAAIVGIDVLRYPNTLIQTFNVEAALPSMPYMPQYFAFYEGPIIIDVVRKIDIPDVKLIIVDGHGIAHPRGFGLACYVGLELNLPCIGIAKGNLLPFTKSTLSTKKYATYTFKNDEKDLGVAIRLQENINPVFISAGNLISLDTSIQIIKNLTSTFRLPDNIRRADQASRSSYKSFK